MNTIVNYLLEVSVCWGVFYLFYHFLLTNQTTYQYNRFYLLAASLLGVVFPLLEIPLGTATSNVVNPSAIWLDPFLALDAPVAAKNTFQWRWDYFFGIVYGVGLLGMLGYYFRQFLSVLWAIRQSRPQSLSKEKYRLLHTEGKFPTSSFFQFLLWDNTQTLSASEARQMMAHEETHIWQKHSYDITYFTLLKIVFWFHPLVYLFERALVENHEFAADAGALQHPTADRQTYSRLLAKQSMASLQWTVVNHFYKSKTLKRIKMMEKNNNLRWYRYALVIPVVTSLFFVFSCQPDTEELEQQAIAESYEGVQAQIQEVEGKLNVLTKKYFENPGHMMDAIKEKGEKTTNSESVSYKDLQLMVFDEVASSSDYQSFENLLSQLDVLQRKLINLPDAAGVFTVVENQPEPVGGLGEFYQHIMNNMKYPKEAREKGIEGKVFVQFVVNEYGELTDFQALKGIGAGCDEEAVRVLEEAPAWNPGTTDGKPVPVRMVLPITFKFDDGVDKADKSISAVERDQSTKKLDEMVVVAYGAKN
ncbi:M56 family metallopeptidase [Tunicatimonas pelagia]|uniref:M56 family metallopeptidase n=1 Tax=Tunicatimonas pelagia TaxID=931531 RepID=UPI0026652A0E|nr:M56 family metallopeptidase [Tunicatimonas pelagia]WKN44325.1 M56 family metallopeptidase [Tunicatimonas pelagia]